MIAREAMEQVTPPQPACLSCLFRELDTTLGAEPSVIPKLLSGP